MYSFLFAAIYPDLVKRMVTIDVPKPIASVGDNWASRVPQVIEKHLQYDELYMKDPTLESTAPVYTFEEALRRMTEAHGFSLTEDTAKILMKRGTKAHKGGLTFTRDIRQKLPSLDPGECG